MPLGVPGEWEWLRVRFSPPTEGLVLAGLGVAAYAGFVALGCRRGRATTIAPVDGSVADRLAARGGRRPGDHPDGSADGYDLTKWAAVNYLPGSAGYFKIARQQAVRDPWQFLAEYPQWIRSQDSLHIGTHPPGLIAVQCLLLRDDGSEPASGRLSGRSHAPDGRGGVSAFSRQAIHSRCRGGAGRPVRDGPCSRSLPARTVVPLYLLARAALPAPAAWAAAALWPLAPAANLFQPVADTAYPLLSTTALALAAWAARFQQGVGRPTSAGISLAVLSGIVMALGMFFTLAFLPVGLIVAVIVLLNRALTWRMRAVLIARDGRWLPGAPGSGWASPGPIPS